MVREHAHPSGAEGSIDPSALRAVQSFVRTDLRPAIVVSLLWVPLACAPRSSPDLPHPTGDINPAPSLSSVLLTSAPPCRIVVGRVLRAERFAGPGPITPALADTLKRDPAFARTYSGISHGDQHLQCTYRVEVGARAYSYMHVVGNTSGAYDIDHCEQVRPDVAREIVQATRECTDMTSGAYYGYVLAPL